MSIPDAETGVPERESLTAPAEVGPALREPLPGGGYGLEEEGMRCSRRAGYVGGGESLSLSSYSLSRAELVSYG